MEIKNFFKTYYYQYTFKLLWAIPTIAILFLIDVISKETVASTMSLNSSKSFIPGLIRISYILNPGSAYGTNANKMVLAVTLAIIGTFLLIAAFVFVRNKFLIIAVTIMLSGSISNLLGRIWEPNGYVIDFIEWDFNYRNFTSEELYFLFNYVFNIADAYVSIGIVLLIGFLVYLLVDFIIMSTYRKNNIDKYKKISNFREEKNIIMHNYELELYSSLKIKNKIERKELIAKTKENKKINFERIYNEKKSKN